MKKSILFLIVSFLFAIPKASFAQEWTEYKRQHFIIFYNEAPMDFVKTVEKMAEDYYTEISQNMGFVRYRGWNWDERAKIYIFDNDDHYTKVGKNARWSHGMASPKDKIIRTYPAAHGFFDTTLPHELAHIIFREFIGFRSYIPSWFEEGIAMYQERAKRWGVDDVVREAMKEGKFLSIDELTQIRLTSNTDVNTVQLFYAESASITKYIMSEFGKHRFVRLCRKLKSGISFEDAFKTVYVRFKNFDALNRSWINYLEK